MKVGFYVTVTLRAGELLRLRPEIEDPKHVARTIVSIAYVGRHMPANNQYGPTSASTTRRVYRSCKDRFLYSLNSLTNIYK